MLALSVRADDVGEDEEAAATAPVPAVGAPAVELTPALASPPALAIAAPSFELEWCVGRSPVSWGFRVTPTVETREVRARLASSSVRLLGARGGSGLPEGWTVALEKSGEVVARGETPAPSARSLPTLFILETDRSTADVNSQGAHPVAWEVWCIAADGQATPRQKASFTPVMDLADATARGIVLATVEGIGPGGPVEITVDNPTWQPLWLDVPAGTIVKANDCDWVVGMCAPFRMTRKQRTGKTVPAFPLVPPGSASKTPRRLLLTGRSSEHAPMLREISLAVQSMRDATRAGARKPGVFEASQPFDFWPLVLQWATWKTTSAPDRQVLASLVSTLLGQRAAAGDPSALTLDREAATAEVEAAVSALDAPRLAIQRDPLSLELQAARARFR